MDAIHSDCVPQVVPREQALESVGETIQLQLPPLSLSVLVIDIDSSVGKKAGLGQQR